MRRISMAVVGVVVLAGGLTSLRAGQGAPRQSPANGGSGSLGRVEAATVATYCAGCHNGQMRSPSGVVLDTLDPARVSADRNTWTRAYRQVQAGMMPPFGAARPDRGETAALLASIERALLAGAPAPGPSLSGEQVAVRLASLLWDGPPDAVLNWESQSEQPMRQAVIEREVQRMLLDDRARAFVSRFFVPWLGLDRLAKADPDLAHFPDYDPALKADLLTETELFILDQLREDADPIELWDADYTFLNERLARHYAITGVSGPAFRRVPLTSPERAGLLGQASVLMATSRHQHGVDAGYTSPASRALWIVSRFLGTTPPQPFPGAQPVKPELPITPQTRALPAQPCENCHRNFFPLGYALEHFDPIGRWRTVDQAGPVDASGTFVDGTRIDGVVALRTGLLQRPEAFRTAVTEQLIAFASGSAPTSRGTADTFARARQVLNRATPARWSSIIGAVVMETQEP